VAVEVGVIRAAWIASAFVLSSALAAPRGPYTASQLAIARAAQRQVGVTVHYDPSYVRLKYPGGDVPPDRGVCSDVVIRAFRDAGVADLQREVHDDMRGSFRAYPRMWGGTAPDANIDHRRVPNLMTFLKRRGKSTSADFGPGDVVAWRLPGGLYHVGIVSADLVPGTTRPYVIHNIGRGAQKEDVLQAWDVIGHYRW
jgi:uncharacterized protein YijF (DUF1287 family)